MVDALKELDAAIDRLPKKTRMAVGFLLLVFSAWWLWSILWPYLFTFTDGFQACRETYGVAIDAANACLENNTVFTAECRLEWLDFP